MTRRCSALFMLFALACAIRVDDESWLEYESNASIVQSPGRVAFQTTVMTWNLLAHSATSWFWEDHRHQYDQRTQMYMEMLEKERNGSEMTNKERELLEDAHQFEENQRGHAAHVYTRGPKESALQMERRHILILAEIVKQRPSILLLQEVDGIIFEKLQNIGYRGNMCVVTRDPYNPSHTSFGTAVMFDPVVFDEDASESVPPTCGKDGKTTIATRYGRKTGNVARLQPTNKRMAAIVVASMHLRGIKTDVSLEELKAHDQAPMRNNLVNDAIAIATQLCNKPDAMCGGILAGGDFNSILGTDWNQHLLDSTPLKTFDFVGVPNTLPTTWTFDYSASHNSATIDQLYFGRKGPGIATVDNSADAGKLTALHENRARLESDGVVVGVWGSRPMGSDHTWVKTELSFQTID